MAEDDQRVEGRRLVAHAFAGRLHPELDRDALIEADLAYLREQEAGSTNAQCVEAAIAAYVERAARNAEADGDDNRVSPLQAGDPLGRGAARGGMAARLVAVDLLSPEHRRPSGAVMGKYRIQVWHDGTNWFAQPEMYEDTPWCTWIELTGHAFECAAESRAVRLADEVIDRHKKSIAEEAARKARRQETHHILDR